MSQRSKGNEAKNLKPGPRRKDLKKESPAARPAFTAQREKHLVLRDTHFFPYAAFSFPVVKRLAVNFVNGSLCHLHAAPAVRSERNQYHTFCRQWLSYRRRQSICPHRDSKEDRHEP